jgi:hypothetical protein
MRIFISILSLSLLLAIRSIAQSPSILNFNMQRVDGTPVVYEFRVPDNITIATSGDTAEAQHRAGVTALDWAKNFYHAHDVYLRSVDFRYSPIPHYVASLDGQVGASRQAFFAVILGSGTVLEPVEVQVLAQ